MSASVAQLPTIQVSDTSQKDADYEDDFEDELDSFIATTEEKKTENDDNKENEMNNDSDSQPEKGSEEIEKGQKEYGGVSGGAKDDETDDDDYMFSDDQKTAMRELIAQRQENDFPDEDPPEYDVKDRLIQLNAELAKESVPEEREHKVGFKEELVAVFAPPPEFSDEEDSQRDKSGQGQGEVKGQDKADGARKSPENADKSSSDTKKKKKTVVVERDGKFEVVNTEDLTPTERELYDVRDTDSPPATGPKKTEKNTNNSNLHAQSKQPSPPKQPRPATANGHTSRRQLRPAQSKQRPKSAAAKSSRDTSLDNFTYTSPYGLSPKQKELMEERAKALEEKKREEEQRKKKEKEEEEKENEEAFQAWLKKKREEDRKKKEKEEEEKQKKNKEEKNPTQQESTESEADSVTQRQRQLQLEQELEETAMESFEPLFQKEEREEAYREWLKSKRAQLKQEKLLKRREEQEMRGCYHTVSRQECEKAFKEWVKKKNVEAKKNQTSERQRGRSARAATRKSRKNAALLRAIRNSNSFQYVDYYGYRF